MIEVYEYHFADGFTMRFHSELPFSLLKVAVDVHHGLVKCKKIVVMEVEVK